MKLGRVREAAADWLGPSSFGISGHGRWIVFLAALGTLTGIGESAVVILVVGVAAGGEVARLPVIGEAPSLELLLVLALSAITMLGATHLTAAWAAARFGARTQRSVQQALVEAYMQAPWHAQNAARAGQLQDLVTINAQQVAHGTQQATTALATAINLLVVVIAALLVSAWATLLLVIAMLVVLLVALPFRARTRRAIDGAVGAHSAMAVDLTETALAARELRVFGVVEPARRQLFGRIDALARNAEVYRRMYLAVPPLTRDVALVLLVLALAVITRSTSVSLTTLGVTVVLVLRALAHAQLLSSITQSLVERRANLDVVKGQLAAWRPDGPWGTRPCRSVREIDLRDVGHTYRAGAPAALDDISLTLRSGEMLGVVGRTGAGKSTLASVILGLTVPSRGSVTADGVPIAEFDPGAWHARTAWVAQEPRLLTGTVRENVRFLRDWVDDAAVEAAVRAAGLEPELERWADGLDHDVGAAGADLSGGERQRVALARAIAGDPDLLVLDEPTSALDAHSEAAVRAALEAVRPHTAVVVIAHRLSTVRTCDRVAVLEAGRLAALGPPLELERTNRWFREALELSRAS